MAKPEVLWEITRKCNAKCIHCLSDAGKIREEELTTEEALSLCDQLAEFSNGVHLIGGEVFLRKDWKKIIERLCEHNIPYTIVTNGINVNRDLVKYLKSTNIQTLGVSLDAGTADINDYIRGVPGLFNRVVELIDILEEEEVPYALISTFNRLNIHQMKTMLANVVNLPVRAWQVQTASIHGRMTKALALNEFEFYILGVFMSISSIKMPEGLVKIIPAHDMGYFSKTIPTFSLEENWQGCHAGKYTFGICSNGNIQGCLCMMSAEEFVLGNIREKPIKEIWQSKDFCAWNQRDVKFKKLKGFCKQCRYSYQCLAGCADTAHSIKGHIGENPLCYHRIETKWQDKTPKNDWEYLFKQIVNGSVDCKGNYYLESEKMLTTSLISKFKITKRQRQLLECIASI